MRRRSIAAVSAALCVLTVASPARADLPAAETVWTEQNPASPWFKSDLLAAAEAGGDLWAGGYQGQVEFLWPTDEWETVVVRPPKPLLRRHSGGSWQNIDLPSINYGLIEEMEAAGPQGLWVLGVRYTWGLATPYLARWDGSAWTSVPPPLESSSSMELAAAPDAVFVADVDAGGDRRLRTYIGGQWTTGPDSLSIVELASHPESGAWLLGDDGGTRVVARWDSGSWQNIPLPEGATVDHIYALGQDYLLAHVNRSHYLRWDGSAWTPVGPPRAVFASDATLSPSGTLWLIDGHRVTNLVGSVWSTQWTSLPDDDYSLYLRSVTTAADRLWITGRRSGKPVAAFASS